MLPISVTALCCCTNFTMLQKTVWLRCSLWFLQPLTGTVLTIADLPVLTEKLSLINYEWYQLGIQLGFDPGVLKGIQASIRGDVSLGLDELLTKWLHRTNPPSTLQLLIDVVAGRVISHQVLARQLCDERGDFPSISGKPQYCLQEYHQLYSCKFANCIVFSYIHIFTELMWLIIAFLISIRYLSLVWSWKLDIERDLYFVFSVQLAVRPLSAVSQLLPLMLTKNSVSYYIML